MLLTEEILKCSLGYLPEYIEYSPPIIDFNIDEEIGEYPFQKVPEAIHAEARTIILHAYSWCNKSFPLTRLNRTYNQNIQSIKRVKVGQTKENVCFSSSLAQELGNVMIAACWYSIDFYRFSSLIVHENMHQALYIREHSFTSSTIRPGSLGYSPWKHCERPGRMLWHSFWTFACQYVFLCESIFEDKQILINEPCLLDFLADMESRILLCRSSLSIFNIVNSCESNKCDEGLQIIGTISKKMELYNQYKTTKEKTKEICLEEFNNWACKLLKS